MRYSGTSRRGLRRAGQRAHYRGRNHAGDAADTLPLNAGHTHDLGHEIFLILQGRAEFEIDGQSAVLGPGQMCIALTDQYHTVRNVGDAR